MKNTALYPERNTSSSTATHKAKKCFSLFFLSLTLSFTTACSHGERSRNNSEKEQSGRTYAIRIEASTRDKTRKTFRLKWDHESPSLEETECEQIISKALENDGFRKEEMPETTITISSSMEKPFTGVSFLGMLTPYKHTIILRAQKENLLLWELRATGPSEETSIRSICPYLMAAAKEKFGQSTGGPIEVTLEESDSHARSLNQLEKKGLLQ